jgi:hypothetical protein
MLKPPLGAGQDLRQNKRPARMAGQCVVIELVVYHLVELGEVADEHLFYPPLYILL